MRIAYYPDTDSLYIDHASRKLDLDELTLTKLPVQSPRKSA